MAGSWKAQDCRLELERAQKDKEAALLKKREAVSDLQEAAKLVKGQKAYVIGVELAFADAKATVERLERGVSDEKTNVKRLEQEAADEKAKAQAREAALTKELNSAQDSIDALEAEAHSCFNEAEMWKETYHSVKKQGKWLFLQLCQAGALWF